MEWCERLDAGWKPVVCPERVKRLILVFAILGAMVLWIRQEDRIGAEHVQQAQSSDRTGSDETLRQKPLPEGIGGRALDRAGKVLPVSGIAADSAVEIPANSLDAVPVMPGNPADDPADTVPVMPGNPAENPSDIVPVIPENPSDIVPVIPENPAENPSDTVPMIPENPSDTVPEVPDAPTDTEVPGTEEEVPPAGGSAVVGGFYVNADGMITGIADQTIVSDGYMELPSEGCVGIQSGAFLSGAGDVREIYIPGNITVIEEGAFRGMVQMEWFEKEASGDCWTEDGVLFSEGGTCILAFPAGRTGSYKVPSRVVRFAWDAFDSSQTEVIDAADCCIEDVGNLPEGIRLITRTAEER